MLLAIPPIIAERIGFKALGDLLRASGATLFCRDTDGAFMAWWPR